MRDSAGIAVTKTTLDFVTPLQRLGEPVLEIGAADADDPRLEFTYIRDIDLATDRIAVTQDEPPEIRVFDLAGRFVRTIGREGEGPGEFRSVWWVETRRDTVWAYDLTLRRLSIFTTTGTFLRSWLVRDTPVGGGYWVRRATGVRPDGSVLVLAEEPKRQTAPGVVRSQTKIVTWTPGAARSTEIGPFPGDERDQVSMSLPPFRRVLLHAAVGDRTVVIDTERPEVMIYRGASLERVVRLRGNLDREITAERLDEVVVEYKSGARDPAAAERYVRQSRIHDTTPAFADLLVGRDSTIWIERYTLASEHKPSFWIVLDCQGRMITTLEAPPYHSLRAVDDRFVVAIRKDPGTDVRTVRVFERPRRSP